jgi:hypothetical protein
LMELDHKPSHALFCLTLSLLQLVSLPIELQDRCQTLVGSWNLSMGGNQW